MSEDILEAEQQKPEKQENPEQPVEDQPERGDAADEKEGEILSRKRRTALVAYLAVLFAVAFLLVSISMIVENRRLQDSNSQNTATLNGKIADLQDEYDTLLATSKDQEQKIGSLQDELTEAHQNAEEQAASITQLTDERDSLNAEKEALTEENSELTRKQEELTEENTKLKTETSVLVEKNTNLDHVYDLLIQAQIADQDGDLDTLAELLEQIEPLKELLSPNAAELYESLILD